MSTPPPDLLPEPVVTTCATSVVGIVPSLADNETRTVSDGKSSKSSVVGLPGVFVPHTTRHEKASDAPSADTTNTPAPTAVEVTTPSTMVVDAAAPPDDTAVDVGKRRTVVDDVVENVRQLLDSVSPADRCRPLGIDADDGNRPGMTVAAAGGAYTLIPSASTKPLAENVEAGEGKFTLSTEAAIDPDGNEALARVPHKAELRAAARRHKQLAIALRTEKIAAKGVVTQTLLQRRKLA